MQGKLCIFVIYRNKGEIPQELRRTNKRILAKACQLFVNGKTYHWSSFYSTRNDSVADIFDVRFGKLIIKSQSRQSQGLSALIYNFISNHFIEGKYCSLVLSSILNNDWYFDNINGCISLLLKQHGTFFTLNTLSTDLIISCTILSNF